MSTFEFSIPSSIEGEPPEAFTLSQGETAFLLGANGTGKSSLMHMFYRTYSQDSVRISAHRQTWFTSDSLSLSPQDKRANEASMKSRDSNFQARWKDDHAAVRANIAIYELIDAENVRARTIAGAVDNQDIDHAISLSSDAAPISIINELLEQSGLRIEIFIRENERILASKNGSPVYSIAELSDGERNAILIASAVLTAKTGSLILIDEPERHLHRSIISPLLTQLFARRNDCAFIVSTHEALLPIDNPESVTMLIRGCTYVNQQPAGWMLDTLTNASNLPEDIKFDIYGSRSKILFVEGTEESMDKPLYGLLFPDVTVVPKGNCRDVERSTIGIRSADGLVWASAFGLVDADGRGDITGLVEKGICAIDCYSVESIYYHPQMLGFIAQRRANLDGIGPSERVSNAVERALRTIEPHRERMCGRISSRKMHEYVMGFAPNPDQMVSRENITVEIPISNYFTDELHIFDTAIEESNYLKLIQRYPLRETPALTHVANELGFRNRKEYESAVLKACHDDEAIREFVISLLGPLDSMLNPPPSGMHEP